MTTTELVIPRFGALTTSQGRSQQQSNAGPLRLVPHLPERQSLAGMTEGFWHQYDVDIIPSLGGAYIQGALPQTADVGVPHTEIRSLLDHLFLPAHVSSVLSAGSMRSAVTLMYREDFDLDVISPSPKLPGTAFHALELERLLRTTQEGLATRKQKTPILGDSILHSFDILAAPPGAVRRRAAEVFASGADEVFEDGMESSFARNLFALLKSEGYNALQAAEELIRSPETNKEVAFEATRLLGSVDDPGSHISRRKFFEELLDSTPVHLRHAAASGLAAMDDPEALSVVERATANERNERLKRYLTLVVDQLQHQR